jgi:hypothetical protein
VGVLRRIDLFHAVLFAMVLLAACAPSWVVLQQAAPNSLHNARVFALAGVSFEGVEVNEYSEPVYVATLSDRAREAYEQGRYELVEQYYQRAAVQRSGYVVVPLTTTTPTPPADALIIRSRVTMLELRNIEYVPRNLSRLPAGAHMLVEIYANDGRLLDAVRLDARTRMSGGSIRGKMPAFGRSFAERLIEYLDQRVRQP